MAADDAVLTAPMHCPAKFGRVNHAHEHAPGIVYFSLEQGGVFVLSPERNAAVHPAWRLADGAYEADCAWAIVCYTFPEAFSADAVREMPFSLKNYYPDAYQLVTGESVLPAESRTLRERAFAARTADQLVVRSSQAVLGSNPVMMRCWARRGADGPESQHLVPAAVMDAQRGEFGFVLDPMLYPAVKPAARAVGAADAHATDRVAAATTPVPTAGA